MNTEDILATMTPELVARFRTAIEIGKWPDGRVLTAEQRATCMQAVLVWEHAHLPEDQRTGYIDRGSKKKDEACDSAPAGHDHSHDPYEEKPLRLV